MENYRNNTRCSHNCTHTGRQQVKQIVDNDSYCYPPLLRWLKRNFKLIQLANNQDYNPILPAA